MSTSHTSSAISVNLGTILRLTDNDDARNSCQNSHTLHLNALDRPCVLVGRTEVSAYILLITTFSKRFIEQIDRLRYARWRLYVPIHPTRGHAGLDQIQLYSVGIDLRGYVKLDAVHKVKWGALVTWNIRRSRSPHINFTHLDADSWHKLREMMRREGIRSPSLQARL